ncbi:MAG: hypothetical protein M0R22_02755 [Dehalococcoidia bacterium]|jgi:hypothetical protein|nr:hypothetical protein [Dehalococcoidia bacterium]
MSTEYRSDTPANRPAWRWSLLLLPLLVALLLTPSPHASGAQTESMIFESTPDDGHLTLSGSGDWDALKTSQKPADVFDTLRYVKVNTRPDVIYRGFLFFDTAAIPDDADITNAVLHIYAKCTGDLDDTGLYVLSGTDDYPHQPLVPEDYALPAGGLPVCARVDVGSWTRELAYREVPLDEPGAVVRVAGTTKLCLPERRDYENETPPDLHSENELKLYSHEEGDGFRPYLEVFWTAASPAGETPQPEPNGPGVSRPVIGPSGIAALAALTGAVGIVLWKRYRPSRHG